MFKWIIGLIPKFIKTWFTNLLYKDIAKEGINGDTELAYLTPYEQSLLLSLGGAGTYNKKTNLKQYWGPLAIGLAVGTAAFGIAKLTGMSTRKALMIGAGFGLGAGGISALGAGGGALTSTGASSGLAKFGGALGAGSPTAAKASSVLANVVGAPTAQGLSAAGITNAAQPTASFMLGNQAATPSFMLGNQAAGAFGGGSIAGAPAMMGPQASVAGLQGQGLTELAALNRLGPESAGYMGFDKLGNAVSLKDPNLQSVARPDLGTVPISMTDKVVNFAKENPWSTAGAILTGGKMISDYSAEQPTYDDDLEPEFTDMEGEIYRREREKTQPMSDRLVYDDEELPENIYDRPDFQPVMVAREGGLATLKLKEGGINYLPSKLEHDEKDSNNYVRAKGYVEDGSGVGDKDEDTMLAQLADGEFVSRADAILGAGIMEGANPEDFKDMRKKGAQFFYGQQDKLKRIYDIVSDANKES